ncbi:hypothetical protein HDU96_009611 [Phlyctochytrium bullatum]|nr:hypothetical protein HDU96_009611 [Phlyctochytrium bullatum]
MSLQVEVAPLDGEQDFVVGYPCVGPVTVKGTCRVSNVGRTPVLLNFLEVQLSGESGGSLPPLPGGRAPGPGQTVEAMSLLFARQVLVVTEHPPIPINCATFLDLPFQFEFTRENAALLPPSSCISRDYVEGFVKYELKVEWKETSRPSTTEAMRALSRNSDPFVFQYPRFDLEDLIQYFYGKSTKGISGRSDDNTVKFNLVLPNSLIPDDVFKFEYAVVSTEQSNAIKAVHLQIWERLTLETMDGNECDKHDLVFIYTGEPSASEPSMELKRKLIRIDTQVLLRAPKWVTSSQPITDVTVISPTVVSGSVKISHFMRVLLEVQSGLSVTIDSDVTVIPVTRPLLADLASKPDTLRTSGDPKATKLAAALESLGPSIATAVSMNRNLMSEDEELAFALQASMKAAAGGAGPSAAARTVEDEEDEELKRALQISMRETSARSMVGAGSSSYPVALNPDGTPAPPPRAASKITTINGIMPEDEAIRIAIEKSQKETDPVAMAEEEAIRLAILESQMESSLYLDDGASSSSRYGGATVSIMPIDQPIRPPRLSSSESLPLPSGPNLLAATSSNQNQPIPLDNEDDSNGIKRGPGFFTIVGSKVESAFSLVAPTAPVERAPSPTPTPPPRNAKAPPPRTVAIPPPAPLPVAAAPPAPVAPAPAPVIRGIVVEESKPVSYSKILEELGTKPAVSGITVSASTSANSFSPSNGISITPSPSFSSDTSNGYASNGLSPATAANGRPIIEPRLSSRLSRREGFKAGRAPDVAPAVSVQLSQTSGGKLVIQARGASAPQASYGAGPGITEKPDRRVVLFDYTPDRPDEIPLRKGAVVIVTKKFMDGGCLGYLENEGRNFEGRFPFAALSPQRLD